jgi:membrane fusion protein (multidrug efflux system)
MRSFPRALSVLLSASVLAACGSGGGNGHGGNPMMGMTPEVTVVRLTAQPVMLTRELPGRTSAYLVAEVRPQVTGIVKRRLFTEGAIVKAGEELYELDDAVYRAQYNSAKANLAKAQASLEAARSAARRSAELVKIEAVSAQDNDNAIAAMRQGEADVGAAEAAVASAEVNLGYARITAPISGRIGVSSVTPGALVTANQATSLATIQQLDPIYVDVNQSSSDWLRLKQDIDAGKVKSEGAGTAAGILLEDNSRYAHDGKLQFADVTVDPSTGSFLLRVVVPNPKNVLMPGMYVRAVLPEGVRDNGVLAPQRGIMRDQRGNASALVVGSDGKVQPRVVHVSRTIGDQWLVDDGLAAGDQLIVEGLQKIQPGMPVHAVEAGAAGGGAPGATAAGGAEPAGGGAAAGGASAGAR